MNNPFEIIEQRLSNIELLLLDMKHPPKESKFISRLEARKKLGISMPTLDKALKDGTLIGHRIGGRVLLKELELSEFNNRKRK